MPQDLTDDKSTLVQVMAWCCQATNRLRNQWWPRSPTPYGVTGPNELKCLTIIKFNKLQVTQPEIREAMKPPIKNIDFKSK